MKFTEEKLEQAMTQREVLLFLLMIKDVLKAFTTTQQTINHDTKPKRITQKQTTN